MSFKEYIVEKIKIQQEIYKLKIEMLGLDDEEQTEKMKSLNKQVKHALKEIKKMSKEFEGKDLHEIVKNIYEQIKNLLNNVIEVKTGKKNDIVRNVPELDNINVSGFEKNIEGNNYFIFQLSSQNDDQIFKLLK
jgi:predicted RNA-binding protein with EMAP domain